VFSALSEIKNPGLKTVSHQTRFASITVTAFGFSIMTDATKNTA